MIPPAPMIAGHSHELVGAGFPLLSEQHAKMCILVLKHEHRPLPGSLRIQCHTAVGRIR